MLPPDLITLVCQTWADRAAYLRVLERLPLTLCRMDAYRRNLRLKQGGGGTDDLVALDWSYVGQGSVGEEMLPLIVGSALFREVDSADLAHIEGVDPYGVR